MHEPESTRDHRELLDAVALSSASRDILIALGRSGVDPDAVLDALVDRASRLCGADAGQLYLVDGEYLRLSRTMGAIPAEFGRYVAEHPVAKSRSSLVGRVAVERRTQQIPDVLADADYQRLDLQRLGGYRTLMSAPMVLDDEVVGVFSMWRLRVAPFDDRELRLLDDFGLQGAIVLRQVRLVRALEERTAELAERVAQLEALRQVAESVSSSLNLDEVLHAIVTQAVELTGADGGSIMEYVAEHDAFRVRTACGSSPALIDRLRSVTIEPGATAVGQAAVEGRPVELADLAAAERLDPHLQILFEDGWRSVLAVPMRRRDQMVGALVIRRRTPGSFGDGTRELLGTFASQSVLAILNARLFRELEVSTAELEVVSRHKSEFLASMSHELRTPLNAVIGFSEVLLDQLFGELNERQSEYLRDIWSSGRHLLELLNEILDLSKVEAGRMELQPTTFRVADALDYAAMLVRERAQAHAQTVAVTVAPEVDELVADELRFKQVMVNLLSNAVKFTPDGGQVRVAARRTDGAVEVTVTDTGAGVPAEDRERIFESFQQGGRGTPKEEGTGLGLTLSRRIVELFGGRLWLETEEGAGSTFGFTVPVEPVPVEPVPVDPVPRGEPAAAAEEPAAPPRPAVLLVDDDRASLELLSAYLEPWPVDMTLARDGLEALAAVRRSPPAAVVLDLKLPGMDGWRLLEELKSDPGTAGVPVVVVTVVDERARGLAMGADDYLTKPVSRDALVGALQQVGVLAAAGAQGVR